MTPRFAKSNSNLKLITNKQDRNLLRRLESCEIDELAASALRYSATTYSKIEQLMMIKMMIGSILANAMTNCCSNSLHSPPLDSSLASVRIRTINIETRNLQHAALT